MDETGQNFEEDPAAAFLARERDELAGIDDETYIVSDTTVAPPTGEGILQEGEDLFGFTQSEEPSDPFTQSEEPPVSSDPYSAILRMDETPDCILKWREEQEQMLSEKDQAEAIALQELRDIACREIEEWYSHHEDTLKHTKDSNRQAEEAFVEERDEDIPGHEWERVARICDFNPKSNKNTKDVSRMRSIFLQLKQSPPVH